MNIREWVKEVRKRAEDPKVQCFSLQAEVYQLGKRLKAVEEEQARILRHQRLVSYGDCRGCRLDGDGFIL